MAYLFHSGWSSWQGSWLASYGCGHMLLLGCWYPLCLPAAQAEMQDLTPSFAGSALAGNTPGALGHNPGTAGCSPEVDVPGPEAAACGSGAVGRSLGALACGPGAVAHSSGAAVRSPGAVVGHCFSRHAPQAVNTTCQGSFADCSAASCGNLETHQRQIDLAVGAAPSTVAAVCCLEGTHCWHQCSASQPLLGLKHMAPTASTAYLVEHESGLP